MPARKSAKWPRKITSGHASVTVYRNAHPHTASGWIYVVAWNSPQGRQREKFADQGRAIDEARIKVSQLAAGRVEGASMSSAERDELVAARRLTDGVPLISALEEWAAARRLTAGNVLAAAKAWAARNGTAHTRLKVSAVVAQYLKAKTAAGKNVASNHRSNFDRIVADLGDFYIDTLPAKQLDAWLANWEHPVTRNTVRKRLVSVWRWAQRKGYLSRDARTEAELTDTAHEPAPIIGIISVEVWEKLLRFFRLSHPELLAPLVLAGFCGLRRAEIHRQKWEDIALDRQNLRVSGAKRGTPARRLVPLCPAAIEWLLLCPDRSGAVCETLAVDGIRRIVSDAGLAELPENCFRHSFISHRVAATGDIARTSLEAGNSPKEINRHYRELVRDDEGRAWFAISPTEIAAVVPMKSAAS